MDHNLIPFDVSVRLVQGLKYKQPGVNISGVELTSARLHKLLRDQGKAANKAQNGLAVG